MAVSHLESPGSNSLLSRLGERASCAGSRSRQSSGYRDSLRFHSDDERAAMRRIRVVPRGDPASLTAGRALSDCERHVSTFIEQLQAPPGGNHRRDRTRAIDGRPGRHRARCARRQGQAHRADASARQLERRRTTGSGSRIESRQTGTDWHSSASDEHALGSAELAAAARIGADRYHASRAQTADRGDSSGLSDDRRAE